MTLNHSPHNHFVNFVYYCDYVYFRIGRTHLIHYKDCLLQQKTTRKCMWKLCKTIETRKSSYKNQLDIINTLFSFTIFHQT